MLPYINPAGFVITAQIFGILLNIYVVYEGGC